MIQTIGHNRLDGKPILSYDYLMIDVESIVAWMRENVSHFWNAVSDKVDIDGMVDAWFLENMFYDPKAHEYEDTVHNAAVQVAGEFQ